MIVGVLPWYDEQPSMLGPCVAGFARFIDVLVAVDGAYALFPRARARSHPSQAETITRTCEAAGIECVLYQPREVWYGNEVAKRNMTLDLARPFCNENSWIVAIDSDYTVERCDPQRIRAELAATDMLAATYTLIDGHDLLANPGLADHARTTDAATEWTFRTRGIYRWTDDLRYGPAHWTISGTYDGQKQWVYGPDLIADDTAALYRVPAVDLGTALVVHHRRDERAKVRRDAAERYYQRRDTVGAEKFSGQDLVEAVS